MPSLNKKILILCEPTEHNTYFLQMMKNFLFLYYFKYESVGNGWFSERYEANLCSKDRNLKGKFSIITPEFKES